ncbi:hypothetical protein I546_5570 [Mycobacterium kansasii 732]|nr:hypothetical protein I546_5570 [Mycobacterium kansasii 732]
MNAADNMGRAILRINMGGVFPGLRAGKPARSPEPAAARNRWD